MEKKTFPSTKERAGYWLGVCDNVGDLLTFWILTDDTEVVLARSVVRPAEDDKTKNKRVNWDPELDPDAIQDDSCDDKESKRTMSVLLVFVPSPDCSRNVDARSRYEQMLRGLSVRQERMHRSERMLVASVPTDTGEVMTAKALCPTLFESTDDSGERKPTSRGSTQGRWKLMSWTQGRIHLTQGRLILNPRARILVLDDSRRHRVDIL